MTYSPSCFSTAPVAASLIGCIVDALWSPSFPVQPKRPNPLPRENRRAAFESCLLFLSFRGLPFYLNQHDFHRPQAKPQNIIFFFIYHQFRIASSVLLVLKFKTDIQKLIYYSVNSSIFIQPPVLNFIFPEWASRPSAQSTPPSSPSWGPQAPWSSGKIVSRRGIWSLFKFDGRCLRYR